jgi:hypothetical protein
MRDVFGHEHISVVASEILDRKLGRVAVTLSFRSTVITAYETLNSCCNAGLCDGTVTEPAAITFSIFCIRSEPLFRSA